MFLREGAGEATLRDSQQSQLESPVKSLLMAHAMELRNISIFHSEPTGYDTQKI